ncbi:MAG: NAD(P)H-binding protein [Paracoccaceae bacterium]
MPERERATPPPAPRRVLLLGASGTIGRATARALAARGHTVVCPLRPAAARTGLEAVETRDADVLDPASLARDGLRGERFDALVSCLASRTGRPAEAWALEHRAQAAALDLARGAGVGHVVLLSAICVQKPRLAFQHAKLAFERELTASDVAWSIVRPTAYFKSLSGQIGRLRRGRAFLIFGDGRRTAAKPIGADDLGAYLASCLDDPAKRNRVLPIGGPGPAITPREAGETLFAALGKRPRFASVPFAALDAIVATLAAGGRLSPRLADKAELARIGRYYATESMLVLDPATGRYDADATPETGRETLSGHYERLVAGTLGDERGAHAVF